MNDLSNLEQRMQKLGLTNTTILPPQRNVRARNQQQQQRQKQKQQQSTTIVPVTAIHMAQEIDLEAVQATVFSPSDHIQRFGKTSIVVRLANEEDQHDAVAEEGMSRTTQDPAATTATSSSASFTCHSASHDRYVAVYRFGSIIFINMDDDRRSQVAELVRQVQQHARQPALYGFERTETFSVHVVTAAAPSTTAVAAHEHQPAINDNVDVGDDANSHHRDHELPNNNNNKDNDTATESVVTADYCIVPELDVKGVAVISNILAQSVALENYDAMMDTLLHNFERINQTVTQNGHFPVSDARAIDALFKTVSQNNCIYLDMVSKIRIKDRAETAWDFVKYESIHYGLKEEFEIDERFDSIEFKLNLIQQNSEFYLQVLQEENSSTVELIIITLICLEGLLMIVEMSGLGEAFFKSWLAGSDFADSLRPRT